MKRLATIILFLVSWLSLQPQSWIDASRLSGSDDITVIQSRIDPGKNIYLYGLFKGTISAGNNIEATSFGGRDYFLCKYDSSGNAEWIRNFGSIIDDGITGGLVMDNDDHAVITGGFSRILRLAGQDFMQSSGMSDIFIANISPEGEVIWSNNSGMGSKYQIPTYLAMDREGYLLLAGTFMDSIMFPVESVIQARNPYHNQFFAKLDADDGEMIWAKKYESLEDIGDGMITGISARDDFYVLLGTFRNRLELDRDTILSANNSYDVHVVKTNTEGDIEWIRKVQGNSNEMAGGITQDTNNDIYVAGYSKGKFLQVDSTDIDTASIVSDSVGYDLFLAKYDPDGTLMWLYSNKGTGNFQVNSCVYQNGSIVLCGSFSNTIVWGDSTVATLSDSDYDMIICDISTSGIPGNLRILSGINGSYEEALSSLHTPDRSFAVIRSNASVMHLEDKILTSSNSAFHITIGIIGCKPLSLDNIFPSDVQTCYGDSTGSIQLAASGGFGSPYYYSIDGGVHFQYNDPVFTGLISGKYPIALADRVNCIVYGPEANLGQPDSLSLEVVDISYVTDEYNGSVVVAANGGTLPYQYTLQPTGTTQAFGTFTFGQEDTGTYVVEVDDAKNCGPVATDSIEIGFHYVGMEEEFIQDVKLYPNPASGMITIEMPYVKRECILEVINMKGEIVWSRRVFTEGGLLRQEIDVSGFLKGVYLLQVDGVSLNSGVVVK